MSPYDKGNILKLRVDEMDKVTMSFLVSNIFR